MKTHGPHLRKGGDGQWGGEPVRFLLSQCALARASQSHVFPSGCLALSVFICQTNFRLLTTAAQRTKKKKKHLHLKLKLRTGGANEKYCQCTYYNYSFPNHFLKMLIYERKNKVVTSKGINFSVRQIGLHVLIKEALAF